MQYSIDEFEFRMNEFSELLKQDSFSKDRTHKLQNDCKYFANLFADLLRENYKLKDQIIDHLRQISVYREELQRITFDTDQTTQENRKFSKEMASVELLVKYLVEDQKYFQREKERLVNLALLKEKEKEQLIEQHKIQIQEINDSWLLKKNKWKQKFKNQIEEGQNNIKQIHKLDDQIIELQNQIDMHLQNIESYEQEITRKDLKISFYQKLEQEFQAKQTDIDIKHDFAMKELQKKYRNEMKELKIQNANNLKQLQNNYEDKFQIYQRNAEINQAQLEQKTNEFMKLAGEYDALIQLYKDHKDKTAQVVQDLENSVSNLTQNNENIKNQLDKTKEDLASTKKLLKSSREEAIRLNGDIQQLQKEIKSLNLTIQSLENKIKEKVERFQRLQDQTNKEHQKQLNQQKEELVQQSEIRISQIQKNAQEQYDYLMRTKNIEMSKLKGQVDSWQSKFEQYELIHKEQKEKLEQQIKIKLEEQFEKIQSIKQEMSIKDQVITTKEQELLQLKNLLNQKDFDFNEKQKEQQNKYQEEINMLRDGVEILIKTAKKPLEDKILQLTQQCEQRQNQIQNLQNQYSTLQQKYIDTEQRNHERISQLQDELNMSMNVFNKMNDRLGSKLQKMMEQTKILQENYQILNEQIKSKNQEILQLQQEIKNNEEIRIKENHKHLKTVKELQIFIGNKELEVNNLNQQYIEQIRITKELNQKIINLNEIQNKEKELQSLDIQKLQRQLTEKSEFIKIMQQNHLIEIKLQIQKQKTMQEQYEQQINQLQEQLNKEYQDKEVQTDVLQSIQVKKQKSNFNPSQQSQNQFNESESDNQTNDVVSLQREKAELIIHYESLIEQLTQQINNSDSQQQNQGIKIVEKIVYKEQPKKESALQGLDVIVKQQQLELQEVKERAYLEKQEQQEYINQLTQRFQEIMKENEQEYYDLNEQINILKNQISQLQKDNNYLKQDMIEQELKYQIQIQQMKEQSDVQLNTLTETCNQEIEEYKKKYDEKYFQFEQLRKQYQDRMAKPEDTEIIQKLLKDHQELYLLVVNSYDKVKEAGDIIRYLDLEVQNYKKANDMFGGQQQNYVPQPPSLSTQKMIQKVAQIKQELELTQNKIQQKRSENTINKESSNINDDKQLSHLSEFSELNSKIQLDSKLPSKRKKLPKMMTSMRSNFSDAQPSSQNQTSRAVEERSEVPLFRFDQDEQILIEAPVSFNAFVDQRQHGNSQMSQQRQNKYNAYIEKKKKEMINISDIVQQQQHQIQQQQISPAESRYVRKKQESQQPKKFVPYYLRNPEIQPKYKNQKIQ